MAHPWLASAMQPLQALDQELDVPNPTGSQLDVESPDAALRRHLLTDALARFRHGFYGAEIERALINQRFDKSQQRLARFRLARRHPRLHQHLLFPISRPLAIVGLRALLGDADFTSPAVRPQPQVDAVTLTIGSVRRQQR